MVCSVDGVLVRTCVNSTGGGGGRRLSVVAGLLQESQRCCRVVAGVSALLPNLVNHESASHASTNSTLLEPTG
jgi:hypothetical protein